MARQKQQQVKYDFTGRALRASRFACQQLLLGSVRNRDGKFCSTTTQPHRFSPQNSDGVLASTVLQAIDYRHNSSTTKSHHNSAKQKCKADTTTAGSAAVHFNVIAQVRTVVRVASGNLKLVRGKNNFPVGEIAKYVLRRLAVDVNKFPADAPRRNDYGVKHIAYRHGPFEP